MITLRSLSRTVARYAAIAAAFGLAALTPAAIGQSQSGFTYNGLNLTSYQANEYTNSNEAASSIRTTGANYTAVMMTQYQQTSTSNTIAPETASSPGYTGQYSLSPTDAAVVSAIKSLQAQGLTVSMKPQVDSLDGVFRGSFKPSNPAAWFASYQTFILHYAQIASQNNVGMLVIGTELKSLTVSTYKSNWETIISALRTQYPGLTLVYGANATGAGDEFTSVSFWADVDIIGVDGYFPLTNQNDPSLSALVAAWTNNKSNFNSVAALKNLQSTYNKPLIFTEIGYVSVSGTNQTPYASLNGTYDGTEQQNCYEAFFEVFSAQTAWMKGVFWWDWSVSAPAANDTGYSSQNKPAGNVTLPKWFNATTPGFTIAPAQSTVALAQGLNTADVISVTDQGGFTGAVTLAVTGLPAGVTGTFTAGSVAGTQNLTLTASRTAAVAGPITLTVTGTSGAVTATTTIAFSVVTPTVQTITFANPGTQKLGATIALVASSTSGLPITFASTTPAVCSVNSGAATAAMLAVGTCTLTASQGGNATYSPATTITDSFTVAALPTVSIPVNDEVIVSQTNYLANVGGYAQSGGNPAGGSIGINSLGIVAVSTNVNLTLVNATTGAATVLGSWSNAPAVAVDPKNNIYISNNYGPPSAIVKLPYIGGTGNGYAAYTDPSKTAPPACTSTSTTECQLPANLGTVNASTMSFDVAGNLFYATSGSGNSNGNSIYECNLNCLAGTGAPVVIYTEATVSPAPSATAGQPLVGSVSLDSAGNLFFTDSSIYTNSGNAYYSFSSNVQELAASTGAGFGGVTTGFAASPLTLYTLNTPNPAAYGNQITAVVVQRNSNGDTVYFADQNDGIFGFPDTAGGIPTSGGKPTALFMASLQGAITLTVDAPGNLYSVAYSSATGSGGDTVSQITSNVVTVPTSPVGTAVSPSTTTSPITTILNDTTCSGPSPAVTFTANPSNSAAATVTASTTCTSTFTGGASFPTTVSFTPTVAGADSVTVTGKDQSTNSGTVTINGIGSGFTLTPASTSVVIPQTTSTTDTITIADFGTFTGNVTLAVTGLPTGVTATFTPNPGTTSSVLTLAASSAAAIGGPYSVTLTGTSGTAMASTTINVSVTAAPGFTLSSSASSLSIPQSNSAGSTITVNQLSGFSGAVTLAASGLPSGVTATFGTNPTTGTSLLTLAASSTATVGGPVTVTISGTSGTSTQTTTIAVTVTSAPSYTIAPASSTVSVTQGSSNTDTITVTALNGFSSGVTFTATGLPTGVTATFSPNPSTNGSSVLTLSASGTAPFGSTTNVTITGTSGTQTQSTTVALTVNPSSGFTLASNPAAVTVGQGGTATSTITVTDQGGFTGSATLAASGLPMGVTATFGTNPATASSVVTFTALATAAIGTSTVTITGTSGTVTSTTTISLTVSLPPSFTLTAAPATLTITQGSSGNSTVTIVGANNFSGSVMLAASGLPSGVTAVFAPNPATASSVATFTVSAGAPAGTSTVTITGTSGTLTATTTVTITTTLAPSFTIKPAAPTLAIVQGGATGSDALTITGANGFTGMVTLAATGLPVGVTAVFTTNPATASSTVQLTASSTAAVGGPVTVTITGTSGTTTGSTTIALTVNPPPGFTIAAAPATLTIAQTTSVTSTITVTPIGGYTGTPTLTVTGLPVGVTAVFASGSAGTQILTLTASATAGVPTGTLNPSYPIMATLTVTGTSGTLTSMTTVAISIIPAPSFLITGPALVVKAGAQVLNSTPLSIVATNGFAGTVALTCAVTPTAASHPAVCAITPASVTLAGTVAQASTLTITTTGGALAQNRFNPLFLTTGGGTVLAFFLFLGLPRRRRSWAAGLFLVALGILSLGLSGCSSTPNYSNASTGTSVGAYIVTITGTSGTTVASGSITLSVQ